MLLRPKNVMLIIKRFKKKEHWAVLLRKKYAKDKALESFDDFYGSVYGIRWKSMRAALLTEHKYIALVNNFGDFEDTVNLLEADGAINVTTIYNKRKEHMENEDANVFSNDKIYQLESRIGSFLNKKMNEEVETVYKDAEAGHSDTLHEWRQKKVEKDNDVVDYKKSLEQSIKEDSELDLMRIVDPSIGSSAALHEFVPATKLKGMEDFVLESEHYKYYSNNADFPLKFEMETNFSIPHHLHLYTYERGNVSEFFSPRPGLTGALSHFLMDGASILPPLALGVEMGDRVLDACAAPGGKSLLLLQTLYPNLITSNDIMESRTNRIKRLMKQYLYDFKDNWSSKKIFITQSNAKYIDTYDMYDKVLVDVPCTTDRHSVLENDNNIFKNTRVKERLRMPEQQASILANCLRLVRPGGTVVYSTCSLSPVQNDGVVHMALSNVFNEFELTFTIKDLSLVMKPFEDIFKFENPQGMKYGQMVIPFLPSNFGPMYFCKLVRNK